MEFFERLLMNLAVFQIVTEIIQATIGVGLCFGALKWRKGLLTTTAIGWGFVLGIVFAFIFGDILGEIGALTCVAIGVLVMPLLTYTVWINRLLFAVTGDYGYLIDPIDLFFGLFKIELTDEWMLISMIIFMSLGIYTQIKRLEANNIPLNTPVIVYESTTEPNGRIHTANGYIDTK